MMGDLIQFPERKAPTTFEQQYAELFAAVDRLHGRQPPLMPEALELLRLCGGKIHPDLLPEED